MSEPARAAAPVTPVAAAVEPALTFEQTSLFALEASAPVPAPAAMSEPPAPGLPALERFATRGQMAFSAVGRGAAILLRSTFEGKRLTTALAVYCALTQLASDQRSPSKARASRGDVAAYAGVTDRTVDAYAREFERIGLLKVVSPRGGRHHPTNVWRLLQVAGDVRGEANSTPSGFRGEANSTPGLKKKNNQEANVIHLPDRSRRGDSDDSARFDVGMRR